MSQMGFAFMAIRGTGKTFLVSKLKTMFSRNCVRTDGDCSVCSAYNDDFDDCNQDDDFGGTGHGDDSNSDADQGL